MDIDKAKQILEAIHHGAPAVDSADCDAACVLLEQDEQLQRWFESTLSEASEIDRAITTKLTDVAAPQGAQDRALDAAKADGRGGRSPIVRFLVPMAAAAALVFAGLSLFNRGGEGDTVTVVVATHSGATLDAFRDDMADFALNRLQLQHKGSALPELKGWLTAHNAPAIDRLSEGVASARGLGCAVVGWGDNRVSLICFKNSEDQVVHMFVIDRCVVDCDSVETLLAEKVEKSGLETAGWADDSKVYLLVGASSEVHLDSVL